VRGWDVTFPEEAKKTTVATVQDLRVAAAAVITLMAHRDEDVTADGFQHIGQSQMYWSLFSAAWLVLAAILLVVVVLVICKQQGTEKKMRRLCFRFESCLLPRRPVKVRQPVLSPTY